MLSCSDDRLAGKPVVDETTNGFQARILLSDSTPATGAAVLVTPGWYVSGESDSANRKLRTDDRGRIAIDALPDGDWWLEASQGGLAVRSLISWNSRHPTGAEMVLGRTGTVSGSTRPSATVRLYGTDRVAQADAAGNYILDSVAPGPVWLRADVGDSLVGEGYVVLDPSSSAIASLKDSTSTARALWPQSRLACIPGDSSAGSDTLVDFLVPVRLGSDEFAAGLSDLGQLLVTDRSGHALEAQAEDWNPASDSGVVWVRVPTLHPSRGDTLRLLWGKPGFSAARSVGATDSVYGIWHLDAVAPLSNAVANGPAIAKDSGTASETGVVGRGRRFDGQAWMRIPSPSPSWFAEGFTISCWVRLDGPQPNSAKILDLGPSGPPFGSMLIDFDTSTGKTGLQIASVDSSWQRVESLVPAAGWAHLAATWDGVSREAVFYQDGVEQGRVQAAAAIQDPTGYDLLLGNQASGNDGIHGLVDEFRWDERVRTPAWIRHLHFTQVPDRIRVVPYTVGLP